jgi:protein phosphatase
MRLKVSGKTDIGQKRKINQDSLLIDSQLKLFVVADGMGGHKGGEVASRMACEAIQRVIREELSNGTTDPAQSLTRGFEAATQEVYFEANKPGGDDLQGMGTTMVAILIFEKTVYIANVGDSRAYVFRNEFLWRVTEDHSWVNEQLRAGLIQESEMDTIQGKNVITRRVGFAPEVDVDVFYRKLEIGDKYLLCSDGLHGMVTDTWIQKRILAGSGDTFVDESIVEANNNGGDDNVTCLFVEVE